MYYVVINKPIVLRSFPDKDAPVVNIYKVNTVFDVIAEQDGWLKTITGQYAFKDDHIELKSINDKRRIQHGATPLPIKPQAPNRIFTLFKTRAAADEPSAQADDDEDDTSKHPKPGDRVRMNGTGQHTTVETGSKTIDDWFANENAILNVVSTDDSTGIMKVSDGSGNTFDVYYSQVQIQSKDGKEWKPVDYQWISDDIEKKKKEAEEKTFIDRIAEIADFTNDVLKSSQITVSSMRSVHGMPYQFLPSTDNRDSGEQLNSDFGRKFREKIVARAPLLVLQAGIPNFLQGFSEDNQESFVKTLVTTTGEALSDEFKQIARQPGKYYSFKDAHVDYYKAVTSILRAMANLLNIGEVSISIGGANTRLDQMDWLSASIMGATSFGINKGAVVFYINSDSQVSEGFSNATTQSQLAGKINQVGQLGTELQFLLGGASNMLQTAGDGHTFIGAIPTMAGSMLQKAQEASNPEALKKQDYRNQAGFLSSIVGNIQTLIAGGRMIFPEIWSDSQFTKSYNVTIKLSSPTCDNLSIFLNIIVPLIHILGMVMPRSVGYNSYISPYIVRAYYKSMFHIDMGIITGCDIQYGDAGSWSQNGLPAEVTIQLTIKDLYNALSLPLNEGHNDLIGNPMMLDYIANKCGVNIAETDYMRTLKLWYITRVSGRIPDAIINGWRNLMSEVHGRWNNLFGEHWTM